MPVGFYAEGFQLFVLIGNVGEAGAAKITTVDRRARQGIADAFFGIVIGIQHFLLCFRRQFGKNLGRSIGDGAANTPKCLEGFIGIYKDEDFGFQRLPGLSKSFRGRVFQAQLCVFGSGVNLNIGRFRGLREYHKTQRP